MSISSISDVITRISGIEAQLQSLQSGTLLDARLGIGDGSASTSGSTSSSSNAASDPSSSNDFAGELAAAEQSDGITTGTGNSSSLSGYDSSLTSGGVAGGLLSSGGVALTSTVSSQLTAGQRQFASTLSADTGLNPNVVSAWLLAEESGGAAQSRQAAGNNDWLNIGYTDSATYGASDSVWSDPTEAANATASWLKGEDSISGYGTASAGIQAILSTVGQTPAAQIQAIQRSGWSSGGYPTLSSLYEQLAGSTSSIGGTSL